MLHTEVRTVQELLEDLVRLAVTHSGPEEEEPVIALPLLAATRHTLESEEFQETDLSPVTDLSPKIRPSDLDAPSHTVTEELAGRGLGPNGEFTDTASTMGRTGARALEVGGGQRPAAKVVRQQASQGPD